MSGLSWDERTVLQIKARQSGMDAVILYVERLLAVRESEARAEALAPFRALAEDADRVVRLPTVDVWDRGWRQAYRKFGSAIRVLLDGGDQ